MGASVLMGGVKKNCRMGGHPHALPSLWETLYMKVHILSGYNQQTPERRKFIIKENYENATDLIICDHPLIKGSRVITLDKLTSIEIYSILISKVQNKLYSSVYFENLYEYNIDWTAICMSPHLVTYNT